MKLVDTFILIAIIWFAFKGFQKGFILSLFSMLALIVGGWTTVRFTNYICTLLAWNSASQQMLAAVLTFTLVIIAFLLLGKLCKSLFNFVLPGFVDKLLGVLLGGGKVVLFFGILFYMINHFDSNEKILTPERKEKSFFYTPSLIVAQWILPQFQKIKEYKWKSEEQEEK